MEQLVATIDIESNGLLADMLDYSSKPYKLKQTAKLWVVSITFLKPYKTISFVNEEITREALTEALKDVDILIAHNGVKFDFLVLWLFGIIDYKIGYLEESDSLNGRDVKIIDSMILSRLLEPDKLGGHSLEVLAKGAGSFKTDFREQMITLGVIERTSPKGEEFKQYHPLMKDYCEQDTISNAYVYVDLLKQYKGYTTAKLAIKQEHKLADLGVRREVLGFDFDKDLAIKNLEFLIAEMEVLSSNVTPLLPRKPFNKGELSEYTPPKNQFKADGTLSSHMINFLKRHNADYDKESNCIIYKGDWMILPLDEPLETSREATIDDLDVVKTYLIELGWSPSDWKERDLTKDSKKQNISLDKRVKALEKYVQETLDGKYKQERLSILGIKEESLLQSLKKNINGSRPVKVPTTPNVRVGVTKELCPNLIALGDKVDFVKDFVNYLTYKHRKSSIAGGDIEDMDFDLDTPNTGYLAQCREEDGRIPTPAIEIGANTNRYKHIGVANIPRASSLFGEEMRSMFGCGKDYVQFGYDYASLEARIQAFFVYKYEGGEILAQQLLAEKPNDIHTVKAKELGIERDPAKSVNYAMIYGASANKFVKMLGLSKPEAEAFVNDWWNVMLPLKQLKEDKEKEWIASGKKFITSIDGRRINIRSQHSILNALFQSAGVICAKYVLIKHFEKLEKLGYKVDIFKDEVEIGEMISYHDEAQLLTKKELLKFKVFNTKEEAQDFVASFKDGQLGAVQKGKNDKFYVTLPSVISETLLEAIKEVEEMFGMNIPLGIEYVTGRNWADCH